MAINVRKGTHHSLAQSDFTGALKASEGVVAGMLVYKNSSGEIEKVESATAADLLVGFAVTNQDEGDAIESNKIGVYSLDGASVVETDQVTDDLSALTGADVGKPVIYSGTAGKVKVVAKSTLAVGQANYGARVYGRVYDVPRDIYEGQTPITVLPIKLSSGEIADTDTDVS